uniref:Uncharacterized protein n=1 Tax=Rhizophora mucronata TaxID=61149 RepID=A0A2P2PZG6_RHIMU
MQLIADHPTEKYLRLGECE